MHNKNCASKFYRAVLVVQTQKVSENIRLYFFWNPTRKKQNAAFEFIGRKMHEILERVRIASVLSAIFLKYIIVIFVYEGKYEREWE